MKSLAIHRCGGAALACLLAFVPAAPLSQARAGDKLRPEEVVAKHLEAVGAAETRASITARVITGVVVANFRAPSVGQVPGRAVLFSKGDKHAVGMTFDGVANYPHDSFGFDGKDVSAGYLLPGRRSTLGEFLMMNKNVVREGLLGGTLSQAWPLYDLEAKKPKLEYSGRKKVGERPAHALKYMPRGGSDLNITLFFDAETFQHLRTEYTGSRAAQIGTSPDNSARQQESRYRMYEDFSDFRKDGGLTLPHGYKLGLEITLPGGSYKMTWDFTLANFAYNQPIDPKSFDVDDTSGR